MISYVDINSPIVPINRNEHFQMELSREIAKMSWWEQFRILLKRMMLQFYRDRVRKLYLNIYNPIHNLNNKNKFCIITNCMIINCELLDFLLIFFISFHILIVDLKILGRLVCE